MNAKTQQVLLHIAGWMVFLSLPLLFSPEALSLNAYLTNPPTQRDLISYVLVLAVFYLNFYWLIPKFYFSKRYLSFFLAGILCFIPIVFLPAYILSPAQDPGHRPPGSLFDPHSHYPSPDPSSDPYPGFPDALPPHPPDARVSLFPRHIPRPFLLIDIGQHLFLFLGMILFALMLKIRDRWKQTEKEVLQTELAYLKAQINPHFLFNSLNGIYALALEKSDQAPEAIVKLSDMMRYVLNETGKEWVSLEKEIAYIRNYIALQQTRFGDSIQLDFQVIIHPDFTGSPASGLIPASVPATTPTRDHLPLFPGDPQIAPLILIPFIENTFKHGVNAEENSDIHIRIELKENELHLLVINNKVTVNHPPGSHSGLGIDNTKRRLLLLYPGTHILDIHDNSYDFQVSLTLKLT
ncbi:MAG TPA: sensor histidine kinase [Puia sp.]|nr:sensor histidine kinase [Puia sp.]